jgi:CHASE3 domain sensor protein
VPIVERRLARLDSEIVARRSGDAAKAVGTVSFGNGKQLMDSARVLFGLIRREEGGQLALLEERDVKDRRRLQFALVLGALFTTLVSFYATTTLANDATRQWLMSAELHARIDMLRGQVPGRISGETRERSTPTSNQTSN